MAPRNCHLHCNQCILSNNPSRKPPQLFWSIRISFRRKDLSISQINLEKWLPEWASYSKNPLQEKANPKTLKKRNFVWRRRWVLRNCQSASSASWWSFLVWKLITSWELKWQRILIIEFERLYIIKWIIQKQFAKWFLIFYEKIPSCGYSDQN